MYTKTLSSQPISNAQFRLAPHKHFAMGGLHFQFLIFHPCCLQSAFPKLIQVFMASASRGLVPYWINLCSSVYFLQIEPMVV